MPSTRSEIVIQHSKINSNKEISADQILEIQAIKGLEEKFKNNLIIINDNKNKDEVVHENIWQSIQVENTNDDLLPFLITIPLQKLAYYSALKKGYDIDKPRNLAKSVTVE